MKKPLKQSAQINNETKEIFVSTLGALAGIPVVPTSQLIEAKKKELELKRVNKNLVDWNLYYMRLSCRLAKFLTYRQKWKVLTKSIEARTKSMIKDKLDRIPPNLPEGVHSNLSEAYQCFIMGNNMASYIMILRTIELALTPLYDKHNSQSNDHNAKKRFIPAIEKLNWAEEKRFIIGFDITLAKAVIHARNDTVHHAWKPTDLQIKAAFEAVLGLLKKINFQEPENLNQLQSN